MNETFVISTKGRALCTIENIHPKETELKLDYSIFQKNDKLKQNDR